MFGIHTRFLLVFSVALLAAGCGNKNILTLDQPDAETTEDTLDLTDPQVIFLQENAQTEGVIIRPSGLQIRIIKKGDGAIPTKFSMVTTQYHGTLIDGTVFDTTRDNGQPFSFTLDSVIDGWKEALMLMRVGSIFEIVIPNELAYGSAGAGDSIPPGATLIFEVELVDLTQPLVP